MEKLDFKKQKEFYLPPTEPTLINVPAMRFIMVDGKGNPNIERGEYQQAVEILYALSYTIKMSKLSGQQPKGYIDYTVAPLEGLWWLEDSTDMDFSQKSKYCWTSMLRQPEFVTQEVFSWACGEVAKKKPHIDVSRARLCDFEEGLCVHIMHIGPYETEPHTLAKVDAFIEQQGLKTNIDAVLPDGTIRRHHEIYLGDPRRISPKKRKTVLRHPVVKA
ncbi:GyrI-like domain-containing protein [Acetanaerobacterium elongatum]|uniref:GyrI-like small molecule binding domain-containing protein n=1 Tax=Acetanaerobacterium elongatum TaxID=258515 RepID=A0A1G9UIP4_9FIRM|nr:GyrI-like domain-containing protein [Acetanaerobacterium elongatum]SDM59684.1 hypothetical protein SAMN05192585_10225 [Acetanaerobacterium elongatum]